jgi:hypothetical protein
MLHRHVQPPAWTAAAIIEDISDVWIDEVDPENEQGAEVLAYLCEDSDHDLEIRGISVNDGVTLFYDRDAVLSKFLNIETIWRVEDVISTQEHEGRIYA